MPAPGWADGSPPRAGLLGRALRVPLIAGLCMLALSCRAGLVARYRVIEPDAIYALCLPQIRSGWCLPRDGLIFLTYTYSFAWITVVAALLAWLVRGRLAMALAMLSLASGGLGLYLYQTGWSALGVLLALLRLLRHEQLAAQATQFRTNGPPL